MSVEQVRQQFVERFGREPEVVALAPGRINLIGEHTDYNGGFVFPVAIDRGVHLAAARSEETELTSAQVGAGTGFDVGTVEPGFTEDWAKYPAGMGWAMREAGVAVMNLCAAVDSDVPMGSGVSSSAALEMAFGVVWRHFTGHSADGNQLAKWGQRCENGFVGVNSGIMDQMASANGRAGQAMFLDTRSLEIQYAPVPATAAVVLLDTLTPRTLAGSAYNVRRAQCEAACAALGESLLRDADLGQLRAAEGEMPEVVFRRARHVLTENQRCLDFKAALERGDLDEAGRLMVGSHESLRDDYEVSADALNAMMEAACESPGCYGARMTGAGFGGACVALVARDQVEAFAAATLGRFAQVIGHEGEATVALPVDGARIL